MKVNKRVVYSQGRQLIVNNYIINVDNTIKKCCWDFAQKIIGTNNQYDRMLPANISNQEEKNLIRIQRTYVGKIAEYAFLKCLNKFKKNIQVDNMLDIYEGQNNVDDYDFMTLYNETVDIKAAFRTNHKNLVVNLEQLRNIPKNFYVGVKLNAKDHNYNLIDPCSITTAEICGYCDNKYLNSRPTFNLGEAACKAVRLDKLIGIDSLIQRF